MFQVDPKPPRNQTNHPCNSHNNKYTYEKHQIEEHAQLQITSGRVIIFLPPLTNKCSSSNEYKTYLKFQKDEDIGSAYHTGHLSHLLDWLTSLLELHWCNIFDLSLRTNMSKMDTNSSTQVKSLSNCTKLKSNPCTNPHSTFGAWNHGTPNELRISWMAEQVYTPPHQLPLEPQKDQYTKGSTSPSFQNS